MMLRSAVLIPIMAIGTSLGHKLFGITRPEVVKRAAIALLGLLAIVGIGKVLIG
jgi:energy-converting hydrogenase Eha subunit F